ncbi:MAG: hypothetical protein RMJ33_04970 [Saprospiraceae bacterium]|nr:hypothetical protein [Saprospiraceae bacterium]MDW8229172.1 hypothetical protein [Saprospiraceae bacterium]
MKQKQLSRFGGALLLAISLFSLLYVNIDAANGRKVIGHVYSAEKVMRGEEEHSEAPDPDSGAALVTRALSLLHRLVSNLPNRH